MESINTPITPPTAKHGIGQKIKNFFLGKHEILKKYPKSGNTTIKTNKAAIEKQWEWKTVGRGAAKSVKVKVFCTTKSNIPTSNSTKSANVPPDKWVYVTRRNLLKGREVENEMEKKERMIKNCPEWRRAQAARYVDIEAEKVTDKSEKIKGQPTWKTERALGDLTKVLRENKITLPDGRTHTLTFEDRLGFVRDLLAANDELQNAYRYYNPDIKPDNFLIFIDQKTGKPHLKITDMGLAQPIVDVHDPTVTKEKIYKANLRFAPFGENPSPAGMLPSLALVAAHILELSLKKENEKILEPLLTVTKDERDKYQDIIKRDDDGNYLNPEDLDDEKKLKKARQGIELFTLLHKKFASLNENTFKKKLFRAFPRRMQMAMGTKYNTKKGRMKQSELIHKYFDKLFINDKIKTAFAQMGINKEKIDKIHQLLKDMTHWSPNDRPNALSARETMEEILSPESPAKPKATPIIGSHRPVTEVASKLEKDLEEIRGTAEKKTDFVQDKQKNEIEEELDQEMGDIFKNIDEGMKEFEKEVSPKKEAQKSDVEFIKDLENDLKDINE